MIVRKDLSAEHLALIAAWTGVSSYVSDDEKSIWRNLKPRMLDLVLKFPPGCVVMALRPVAIPAPGRLGVVLSYREMTSGTLLLRVGDLEAAVSKAEASAAESPPDWLDAVAYRPGRTPADIMGVIGH